MLDNQNDQIENYDHKKYLVRVHSSITQMAHNIDLVPVKVWYYLLYRVYWYLPEYDEFCIPVKDISAFLSEDTNTNFSYDYLEQVLDQLLTHKISFNTLKKDKKHSWKKATLLGGHSLENGKIYFTYSKYLKQHLINPKLFAKLNVLILGAFSSKYSLILYNIFIDYMIDGLPETKKEIKISDLRNILGIKKDEYVEFKRLNKDVIKKSIDEINNKSTISVSYEIKTEKRKAFSIMFCFKLSDSIIPEKEQKRQMELFKILDSTDKSLLPIPVSEEKKFFIVKEPDEDENIKNLKVINNEKYSEIINTFLLNYGLSIAIINNNKNDTISRGIEEKDYGNYIEFVLSIISQMTDNTKIAGTFVNSIKDGRYINNFINRSKKENTVSTKEDENEKYKDSYKKFFFEQINRYYQKYVQTQLKLFFQQVDNHELFIKLINEFKEKTVIKNAIKLNNGIDLSLLENNEVLFTLSLNFDYTEIIDTISSKESFLNSFEILYPKEFKEASKQSLMAVIQMYSLSTPTFNYTRFSKMISS